MSQRTTTTTTKTSPLARKLKAFYYERPISKPAKTTTITEAGLIRRLRAVESFCSRQAEAFRLVAIRIQLDYGKKGGNPSIVNQLWQFSKIADEEAAEAKQRVEQELILQLLPTKPKQFRVMA